MTRLPITDPTPTRRPTAMASRRPGLGVVLASLAFEAGAAPADAAVAGGRGWLWPLVAALLAVGCAALAFGWWRERAARRAERALQSEQGERMRVLELLDTIVRCSTEIIFAKDLDGHYLWRNRAAVGEDQRAGVQPGDDDRGRFPPEEVAVLRAHDARVVAEGRVITFEEVLTLPQGVATFHVTKGPLHDERGRIVGLFGISRDITERRRAEAAVAASELRLSLALTAANMGVWEWHVRTDRLIWSPQVWHIVGRTPPEGEAPLLTLDDFARHVHPEDAARVVVESQRAMGLREPYIDRFRYLMPDGSIRWFENLGRTEYDTDGQPLRMIGIVRDVTASVLAEAELAQHRSHLEELVSRRTEELIEARDKADAANRAKSVFLANMSHEIRTPMNAIIGLAHLMHGDALMPEQRERLGKVSDAARHLLDILNDILDLSKIESGQLQLEKIDFDLHELLARAQGLVAERAHGQGLGLALHTAHLPRWWHGDPTRLAQALLNLLSNAVKFTPQGHVSVHGELLAGPGDDAGGAAGMQLRFEVRDTGIGIPAEQLGRLFHAFEQADNSTTRRYGGSGLGLVITRQLARLMGGDAGAVSEVGIGSRFWFSVRLQPAAAPAGLPERWRGAPRSGLDAQHGARDAVRRRHAGARLLLAEDNVVNQEVATELLRSAGLEVDIAETGVEAVAMCRRSTYALVLMDVQMPEMNGLQAARAIRALPAWQATPILAMTANAFGEDRLECLAAGMDDHVAKPVDPHGLYETLLRWLPERPL